MAEDEDRPRASTSAGMILALLAMVVLLYVGREVLIPISVSLLLASLLQPVVQRLRAGHVPAPAGAAIVVLGALAILLVIGVALEPPVKTFAAKAPTTFAVARGKLAQLGGPFRRLGGTPQGKAAPVNGAADSASGSDSGARASDSATSRPSSSDGFPSSLGAVLGRVFGETASLLGSLVEVFLLVLFLLAAGDAWREKLTAAVRSPERRTATLVAAREMRSAVARYMVVTTLINIGQAICVAIALWLTGVSSPWLWGALTFVAEFIPYFGGAVMVALLLLAGLASSKGIGHAVLPPLLYLAITTLQNNLVSPLAYGRGLRLNPAAILVAVMVWYALWGVAGAFLAVPILAALRILTTHVERLSPVTPFLEG